MRTLPANTSQPAIREIIEAARKGPVALTVDDTPAAFVLSPEEFERLDEPDRIRREAKVRLKRTIDAMQREAAERGLTEAELERLLADES